MRGPWSFLFGKTVRSYEQLDTDTKFAISCAATFMRDAYRIATETITHRPISILVELERDSSSWFVGCSFDDSLHYVLEEIEADMERLDAWTIKPGNDDNVLMYYSQNCNLRCTSREFYQGVITLFKKFYPDVDIEQSSPTSNIAIRLW